MTTLAVCHSLSSGNRTRQQRYSGALARHLNFITDGCQQISAKYATDRRCPHKGTGWTMGGNNAGAVADGYSDNTLDCLTPYTIAAATCGAAFAELSTIDLAVADGPSRTEIAIGSKANSTALSIGAARWIADTIGPDGTVPYIVTPPDPTTHVLYQPIAYSTESFIDADLRFPSAVHVHLVAKLNATIRFLVKNQSKDGTWGAWQGNSVPGRFDPIGDAQRSPRVLSLLQWWHQQVDPDPTVEAAITRYTDFLTTPANHAPYGLGGPTARWLALPTGFVGLAIADLLQPWSTFRPIETTVP